MENKEQRFFQWIAGERRGEIMMFEKIEQEGSDYYISFKDGSRINEDFVAPLNQTDLTGKLMAEIDSPKNCWKFEEPIEEKPRIEKDAESGIKYEIPSVDDLSKAELSENGGVVKKTTPKNKIIKLIPPKPTKLNSDFSLSLNNKPESIINKEETKVIDKTKKAKDIEEAPNLLNETDPVYILMSKSKKTDLDISMTISISLPSKSLYGIAKTSFDEGDSKFVEYIIQNISVDKIKEALKVAITNMYEEDNEISVD